MFSNMREDHHQWLQFHYLTPTSFEKMGALWPIQLGSSIAKPHYHIGPKITPYYYLIGVVDGQGSLIHNGQQYHLKKNDVFCLFPQVTHEYHTITEEPLKQVFIAFDGNYALAMLERLGLSQAEPHQNDRLSPEILAQFQEIFNQHLTDLARVSLMYQIFDQLAQRNKENFQHKSSSPQTWLEQGKEYLEIHYADLISIENVARHVGIERTHFSKKFQSVYHISPMSYLQQIRMKEAMLLLKQTNYKMSEIAHSVGYSDLPTFSKAFKKINNLSPIQYRQKYSLIYSNTL